MNRGLPLLPILLPVLVLGTGCVGIHGADDEPSHDCAKGTHVEQRFEGELGLTATNDEFENRYRGEEVQLRPDRRFSVRMGFADLLFEHPREVGTQPLVAEVCSKNWEGCTKVDGTIEVRETDARALEARIVIDAPTHIHDEYFIDGEGRVLYMEQPWEYCW